MVLLGDKGLVEAHFSLFVDSVNLNARMQDRCTVCAKRTIGSEIVLDAFDGTPRLRGSSRSSFKYVWR